MATALDTRVPVLVFTMSSYDLQHGTLGVVRSLGRMGVRVYPVVGGRFTPVALSRYSAGSLVWKPYRECDEQVVHGLGTLGKRLGRPTILIPADDQAAVLVAEHSAQLAEWFVYPQLPLQLPRKVADKRCLYCLCKNLGVPCPEAAFVSSLDELHDFAERTAFPVVVKAATREQVPPGAQSTSIARTPDELFALYRQIRTPGNTEVILQEYLPSDSAEDWIFHGYCNPKTNCFLGFTGKKLRSYPAFAGQTALGIPVENEALLRQTEKLLKGIGYAGIVDLDYRFDRRDGKYKLLDFNPRMGANLRLFENAEGVDVVRALHLDLSGRTVPIAPMLTNRKFIVECLDLPAAVQYMRRGSLTLRGWLASLKGPREVAWFCVDDPLPALNMSLRILFRGLAHAVRAVLRLSRIDRLRRASATLPERQENAVGARGIL
jgi:predicted ATP-grasp superfamily ATP-dependent carboligase